MNTEKQKIELDIPSDFKFEEPTLTEFSYNENASIHGASARAKTWDQQVMDDLVSSRNKKKY